MKLKRFFIIVFLLPISWLYAQTDFRPGYVITNSNDTLYGEIDYRGDQLMAQVCKFRSNKRDIVEYSPYDIAAYRFPDNKYFVSREVSGRKVFLEFLIKGQANIYYLRDEIGDHYFIDKEDIPLSKIHYEEGIRKVNDKDHFFSTKTHSVILNYYMQDAPGIQTRISNMKKPEHKNLIKLAEDYHHAVCKDGEPCIVFEKKLPPVKVAMDVVGGMTYYPPDESIFTGGVILNFWLPRTNEKLYFRTGLLYTKFYEKDLDTKETLGIYNLYKIPLTMEYIYPKSIFRPKCAFGWNGYFSDGVVAFLTTCMGGFNVRLSATMSLSLEYNVDFLILHLSGGGIHSFLGGFHFRF